MSAGSILKGARERLGMNGLTCGSLAISQDKSKGRWFVVSDIQGFESDNPVHTEYLSNDSEEARRVIELYELTPSEARECVAIWSQADRAKVAAWDALAPLSDSDIQALIEKLEPGDKVGPFTVQTVTRILDSETGEWRNAPSLCPLPLDGLAVLIQAFGSITKKEGG